MNRRLTALFAALEALLVVGVGIGIPLAPLTVMWAVQYGLQIDWTVFWRAAVDSWLLGHGVDVRFVLDPVIAAGSGLPGAADPFEVTIAPLAFALITLLLGMRAGRRIGETPHRRVGHLVSIGVFGGLSVAVTLSALDVIASPSIVQGALLPTLVFALGILVGSETGRRTLKRDGEPATSGQWHPRGLPARLSPAHLVGGLGPMAGDVLAAARTAARGGAAATTMVLAVSALATAAIIAVDYGQIIALYEGVQSGYLGGVALTLAQLALIPNLVIWAASWFAGPGFAIGTGSAVSPLGTALGPLPAVPVLGALPTGDLAWGYLGLLVPVLAGFLAAVLLRPRLADDGVTGAGRLIGVGLAMGVVAGALLGALAWIASGSAGPGRLVDVGAPWLSVGLWTALEVGVPAAIALVVTRSRGQVGDPETVADRTADHTDSHGATADQTDRHGAAADQTDTAEITLPAR